MKTHLSKGEKLIAVTTIVAISAFFTAFWKITHPNNKSTVQFETVAGINYEMARPEAGYSEYSLDGREVDQIYEGLPQDRELAKAKSEQKKKEEIAKKSADAKKKDEEKKKQQNLAKTQKEQLEKQKLNSQRSAQNDSEKNKSDRQDNNEAHSQNPSIPAVAKNQAVTPEAKAENKRGFAEWRAILFAKPTPENVAAFVAAYKKNEISGTELQAMAQDLLDQNSSQFKGIGLLILRSVPSLASLSQLAHLDLASLSALQSYAEQSLLAYMQAQNISVLNQALATQDKVLVVKVLNLLKSNLSKFSQGDYSSLVDPRTRREGAAVVTYSITPYNVLVPALTRLAQVQDADISPLADQVSTYIKSSNNVAQN